MQIRYLAILSVFLFSNLFAADSAQITNVNFIQEGEVSKLIIDLTSDIVAERTHLKDDKQILLDLKNVTADKKFLRGIDTSEFSGSSVFISPYKKPGTANDIRFAIQLRDNVRSFIERRKNRIILNVENRFGVFTRSKLKKAEEQGFSDSATEKGTTGQKLLVPKSTSVEDILENITQSGVKRYVGKKISINVNDLPYTEVLKMIGDVSGFNIIIDNEVKDLPPLTINLTNLPWDQVLDTVLDLGKLVAIKHGNILSVKTEKTARIERQKELDDQNASKTLEPLVTKIFPLSYAQPADIIKILEPYLTKDRGNITQDLRTQNLIVKDTVDVIERMKKIIDTLDTQTPQILIEAKIVESRENYELKMGLEGSGISFDYNAFQRSGNFPSNDGEFSLSTVPGQSGSVLGASIDVLKRVRDLNFTLDLLESESKVKVISSPKLVTENNKAATIDSTDSRNFRLDGSENQPGTIESVTASTKLTVTPKVTNEGSIIMQIDVSKDSFGDSTGTDVPPVVSNKITTNVLVDNGSTVVVGGIYSTEDEEVVSGIPFLKDLPILGWLFRSAYNPIKRRNELVIFITPRIVNQEEAGLVDRELGDIGL